MKCHDQRKRYRHKSITVSVQTENRMKKVTDHTYYIYCLSIEYKVRYKFDTEVK